jgi:hypothetical protein
MGAGVGALPVAGATVSAVGPVQDVEVLGVGVGEGVEVLFWIVVSGRDPSGS